MTILRPSVEVKLETNNDRKRVAIMGGTFNPIHNGHLIMAEQVVTQLGFDEILFIPNNIPPHVDKKNAIDGEIRAKMVQLAIEDNPKFTLSKLELVSGGISYSIDTIKKLKEENPNVDYYFIIGGDEVEYLPKWHKIDELVKLVTFVAVKRVGFKRQSKYPLIWIDAPLIEISSTDLRQRIKAQQSINYLVPKNVIDYIKRNGLYQDDNK